MENRKNSNTWKFRLSRENIALGASPPPTHIFLIAKPCSRWPHSEPCGCCHTTCLLLALPSRTPQANKLPQYQDHWPAVLPAPEYLNLSSSPLQYFCAHSHEEAACSQSLFCRFELSQGVCVRGCGQSSRGCVIHLQDGELLLGSSIKASWPHREPDQWEEIFRALCLYVMA